MAKSKAKQAKEAIDQRVGEVRVSIESILDSLEHNVFRRLTAYSNRSNVGDLLVNKIRELEEIDPMDESSASGTFSIDAGAEIAHPDDESTVF